KSYVIKYQEKDIQRVHRLLEVLDRNAIQYGTTKNGSFKGYNYETGKEESFTIADGDIVVPGLQPKSALVKVLFEPKAVLADSFTYDSTAWSLPYAYGLKAYGLSQALPVTGKVQTTSTTIAPAEVYGYVIRWEGLSSARLVGQLLQKGIRLRFSETPFES